MLCNKCKKRPAIVFVQRMENGEMKNEGYCLSCARELGIKPLDDIMKQFGISGEDLEAMEDRFAGMMENGDMDPSEMMQNMMGMGAEDAEDAGQDEEEETSDNGEERFVPGGAGTFPLGIFASRKKEEGEKKDPRAKEKGKKRKFWIITARTSPKKRATASWTPSLGATGRFTAPFRFWPAARKTTPA